MLENRERTPVKTPFPNPEVSSSAEDDHMHEECGVFGITGHKEGAVWRAYDAAITEVNRGDQATGVGVLSDGHAVSIADHGNATVALRGGRSLEGYGDAKAALAQTNYSTQENPEMQPVPTHDILLAKNGNISNAQELAGRYNVQVTDRMSDSGMLARIIGNQKQVLGSTEAAIEEVIPKVRGAFSIVVLDGDKLIPIRDRIGWRPLVKGRLNDGSGWAAASETPVFDMIDAESEGTVEPGTYEVIGPDGVEKIHRWGKALHPKGKAIICGMGLAYFERADGQVEEIDVADAREKMGEFLAEDHPVEADMVAPYPDSGRQVATGIAKVLKLVIRDAFYKNHVIGKTYIKPVHQIRKAVKLKLNPIRSAVRGRRLIAAEDSIVRGSTSRDTIRDLKKAGAEEVHMRVAFPPIKHDCHFGMNMKKKDGLLADGRTEEEMRVEIGADSLAFNTPERFVEALGRDLGSVCMRCATGDSPEEMHPERAEESEEREPELALA